MPEEDDLAFSTPVRSSRDMPRPLVFKKVWEAIDFVDERLTEAQLAAPHWQRARSALWAAYGPPPDPGKVSAAEEAFTAALKKQGWHV